MPDDTPDPRPSGRLIRAAMEAAGVADDLALASAVTGRLERPARLSQDTARRWMDGGGIPDAFHLVLCAVLPSLDHAALALALAEQAGSRRGTLPSGEW